MRSEGTVEIHYAATTFFFFFFKKKKDNRLEVVKCCTAREASAEKIRAHWNIRQRIFTKTCDGSALVSD